MQTLRRLALVTTILTLFLIAVGASVRAADAGLGCRSWPQCFEGHWLPPADASTLAPEDAREYSFTKAWIEYANRLVGVLIGFFIVATAVLAWLRVRHDRPGVVRMFLIATLLTGFQGWQGGKVVKYELDPRWVTVHLVTALVILVLLSRATTDLFGTAWRAVESAVSGRSRVGWMARASLFLVATQVVLGALVRGTVDIVANETPDLPRDQRLAETGPIDMIHRQMGAFTWFVIAGMTWILWRNRREIGRGLRNWGAASFGLACLQIVFGLGLAYGGLPPALQVLHIASACALVVALDLTQRFASADLT